MYTSGWPKIQKRCCQRRGSPPPAGSKKCQSKVRWSQRRMFPAESAGNAKTIAKETTRIAQQKRGSRLTDMPGARSLKIVTMKLTAPAVVEIVRKSRPRR